MQRRPTRLSEHTTTVSVGATIYYRGNATDAATLRQIRTHTRLAVTAVPALSQVSLVANCVS